MSFAIRVCESGRSCIDAVLQATLTRFPGAALSSGLLKVYLRDRHHYP